MPVQKVSSGYRWGPTGKVYPTRKQAEMQGAAIESSKAQSAIRWPAKKGKERKRA
ncbi:hypothetical protein SEA_ROONEY_4 [Streptomyces phage Rooney]|nr:hypothetical protein SEA_GIBSON_4 [Streptomyces phage Gibson]QYW07261.1 hypothetical protein SEA_ROONEY_4 [Streptomyces phage Rooney]